MAAALRPDGLYDVTMDNGETVPMNLSKEQLVGMGHEIMPAPGMSPQATAFNGGAGGASGFASDTMAPVPGAGGASPGRPQGMAATSIAQPTDQPGGLPPSRSAVFADIRNNPNMSEYEKDQQIADITNAQPTESNASPASSAPGKVDPSDLDKSGGSGGASAAPRATPARLIPGKDVRASYTRRPGQELPEDIKSEFESDRRPEDYEARAQTIADMRDEQQTEREAHLMERRNALEVERSKRAQVDQKLGEKEKLISQREQEADKLTPRTAREVWNDKGTFGQLMAAVSVAIGGYLQGSGRTSRNQGLDQLNASIESDVQGERQKYEDALAKGKVAQNDYAKALELYGTPEAAEQDLTMRRLAIAEKVVENHGQAIGTQESRQAAEQIVAGLRQQRAETKRALYEDQHGRVIQENYVLTPDRYVGGGTAPGTEKGVHQYGEDLEKAGVNETEAQLGGIQDLIARLPDEELPTENTRNVVSRATRSTLDFVGGYGTAANALDSPAERKAVAGVEKIKGKLRKELSGVSVNEKEQHALDQQLDGINTKEGLQRYAAEMQRSVARRKAAIRASNNPNAVQTYEGRKSAYGLPKRVEAKPDD